MHCFAGAVMKIDLNQVEEAAKNLYIRALKLLPPDIKAGFTRLDAAETDATGKSVLGTMIRNIKVAEANDNLLCQDTLTKRGTKHLLYTSFKVLQLTEKGKWS